MDGLALLQQARAVGLSVVVELGSLKIKSPRKYASLSHQLIDNKTEVIAALAIAGASVSGPGTETQGKPALAQVLVPAKCPTNDPGPAPAPRAHRLIENGFPPCPTAIPPASILATPLPICPRCSSRPVLSELRAITDGLCYGCWAEGQS
jgi:hypothetical protein